MRFTWLSNAPWAPTGYGNQTALIVPRLKEAGHEPAVIAFYGHEGTPIFWNGIQIYPKGRDAWGNDVMDAHTVHWGADVCISLVDAWVIQPDQFLTGTKWIPYFPVDMDPLAPPVADAISRAYRRIVFSKYGQQVLENAGLDCYYIPHCVDTQNEYMPVDPKAARERLGWPQDKYIVGMVAANKGQPSRKAWPVHLEAFARFHKRHPDSALYLHTTMGIHGEHSGVNLVELCEFHGLSYATLGRVGTDNTADVLFCDQYINLLGFPAEYMRYAYSAMDVHMLVSMGEGFGIPTVEAQACGTPVILSDWTASAELCFSGVTVKKNSGADRAWTPLGAYQWQPRVGAVVGALEQMFKRPGDREKARAGALQYDADKVIKEYWLPALAQIEQDAGQWR